MRKYLWGFVSSLVIGGVAGFSPAFGQLVFGQEGELFDKLDANKDGVVTSDEVPDDKQSIFERLLRVGDANGDKKLSKDELVAGLKRAAPAPEAGPNPGARPGAPGGLPGGVSAKDIFGRLDKDGNGKIEKDEIPERMKENLGRVDSNSDGVVDLAEFEKVAQFFAGGGRRPEGAPAGAPEGRPGPGLFSPVVRALDADGDGELSSSEIADASKALAKLDKNNDGKLTRDEIGPPPGAAPQGRPGADRPAAGFAEEFLKRIAAADTNGDKKLSKEEAPDRLKENFDRLDSNSDGQLDEAELKAAFQRKRE
jgi:Ca2+-binding EF-hand superfamily protein